MPLVPGLPPMQVRVLAKGPGTGPNATVPDSSVSFELVWVAPLSPCHGVVQSATFREAPIDYGDVVLWDGAPVSVLAPLAGREGPRGLEVARVGATLGQSARDGGGAVEEELIRRAPVAAQAVRVRAAHAERAGCDETSDHPNHTQARAHGTSNEGLQSATSPKETTIAGPPAA